jgi:hypothetical protein
MPTEQAPPFDSLKRLRAHCLRVGFDLDRASPSLVHRMQLLAERSQTLDDATRTASYAERIFDHYDATKPSATFTPLERRTIVLACLFSDVGKTGPVGANEDDRRLIVDMFSVEGVRDEAQPVSRFLRTHFPEDCEERIARFAALGLDPEMSMRQFWNLHSGWTLAVAEEAQLPPEAVAAAATHHLLDNVNPQAIVGDDHRFTRDFGDNRTFDRAEKLVIVLDKYDALRRRGRRTHDQAIEWLRDRVAAHPRFRGDRELETLIADVDEVLKTPDAPAAG